MSEVIESGAMARTTKALFEGGYSYGKDMEFEVEEYVTAEEAEDTHGYYMGSNHGGSYNVEVREDHVELVRSREEMRSRKLPTPAEVAAIISSEVIGFNDLNIDEADYSEGNGSIELYGSTREGLRFAVNVKVLSVEHADF